MALGGLAGLAGLGLGATLPRLPRIARRRGPDADSARVMPESDLLQRAVESAPIGVLVVDSERSVPVSNLRVTEMGLVRDGVLDDRLWAAVLRTLTTGEDAEVDLSAPRGMAGRYALATAPT